MTDYSKFTNEKGRIYAFINVPKVFLEQDGPDDTEWSHTNIVYDDEEVISYDLMSLDELLIHKVELESSTLCMLAAKQAPTYRNKGVDTTDMDQWQAYLTPKSFGIDTWLTLEEYRSLLPVEDGV